MTFRLFIKRNSLRIFLFVISLCAFPFLCVPGSEARAGQNQPLGLTDTEFKKLVDAANQKAKERGYKIAEMEFSLSKDGKLFVAQYGPKQHYEKKL